MDFVSSSPVFSTTPLFFKFHINHSFLKIFIIIRFSSFDNISRRHTSWIIRVFCVHSFSTDTVSIEKNCGIFKLFLKLKKIDSLPRTKYDIWNDIWCRSGKNFADISGFVRLFVKQINEKSCFFVYPLFNRFFPHTEIF